MKPTYLITTLLGIAGMFSIAHAGGLNPANVSADAKWLLHYDADAAKSSEVGEHLLGKMSDVDKRRLQAVKRLLSINPVEDLKSVTLYGTSIRHEDAILVVRVDHNADHVADLIAAADNYTSKSAGNQVIHQIDCGHGHSANIILIDDAYLVAAGSEGAVRRGAALVGGKGKSMKGSDKAGALSKGNPIFTAWVDSEKLEMRGRSKMAREVKSVTYFMGEKDGSIGWYIRLEMGGEDTAKMVKSMADGMLEYAKKQKNAEQPMMQKALAAIESKVDGSHVHMWAAYDNGEVIKTLDWIEEKMKNHKRGSGCPLGFGRKGGHGHGRGDRDEAKAGGAKCPKCDKDGCKGCDKGGDAKCPKCDKDGCKGCEKGGEAKAGGAKCPKCDKDGCKGCDKGGDREGHRGHDHKGGDHHHRGHDHKGGDHDRDHRHHGKGKVDDDDDGDKKGDMEPRKPHRRT